MVGVVLVGDVEYSPPGPRFEATAEASGRTIRVPQDHQRIQLAVDAALPGDLILIDRGVYFESVRVTTPSVVLRGVDRNDVVLDGQFQFGNGVLVLADGVAVENLTARHFTLNGFYWTGVEGFRGSYLTAYNNGDYGVYAFDSHDGLLEDSYASGHPDAGFYVGQCYPCRTIIRNVVSEHNALGYSGTNAGGELYLVESEWRENMAGIVPNTLDTELLPPERETTIVGNFILHNQNDSAPAKPIAWPAFGAGILVAGGVDNVIERNAILSHRYGILILPSSDEHFWPSTGNRISDNRLKMSSRADLAAGWPGVRRNCFDGNVFETSAPLGIEGRVACGDWWPRLVWNPIPAVVALRRQSDAAKGDYPHGDWKTQPEPGPKPTMPDALDAPARPAVGVFDKVDLDLAAIALPDRISDEPIPVPLNFGNVLERSVIPFLPLGLWLVWTVLALSELLLKKITWESPRLPWIAAVVALPLVGAAGYLAFGGPSRTRQLRRLAVLGGLVLYFGALALAAGPDL